MIIQESTEILKNRQYFTATYSPEDNKLRMYTLTHLDTKLYQRVHDAGFRWAPKQKLFVAPKWTPQREDLLIDLCGEVGDEDTSLVDRAEQRAERFEDYSDNRREDADRAKAGVSAIADNIPLGQPILVGHHSERHARKDAERIENGMRRAIKMWETSEYWTRRAAGAVRAAKYKEQPTVRARRIKGIEADKRKAERDRAEAEKSIKAWQAVEALTGETQQKAALHLANYSHISKCFTLAEYPREEPISQYEGFMSLWSALDHGIITPAQAAATAIPAHERAVPWAERWITHYDNRLLYEKAMLDDQGASDLLKPKPKPTQLPLLNYKAPEGISVENMYHRGEFSVYSQTEMTKAEYAKIYQERKGTVTIENSHRVRIYIKSGGGSWERLVVFLTDSKTHEKPAPIERRPREMPVREPLPPISSTQPEKTEFDDLRQILKEGVEVVSVPQLFPTPPELAARVVKLAQIEPEHSVLEPSAGTGNILKAIGNQPDKVAVEVNPALVAGLMRLGVSGLRIHEADFLTCNSDLGKFDRIVMNPPFKNGEDIKHIKHALKFLKLGGRLVAICANGPRQQQELKPLTSEWLDLESGTFKDAGTNVSTAILIIDRD